MTDELDTEPTCLACDGETSQHDSDVCTWTNDDCPESCSTEHDEPEPDGDGEWQCPETEQRYTYCTGCGWETNNSRYQRYPTYIDGEWYCDPNEHGWEMCSDCGEWCSEDYVHYSERRDLYLCESCDDGSGGTGGRGWPLQRHACCGTPDNYFHEDAETFLCKCKADIAKARREPVVLVAA